MSVARRLLRSLPGWLMVAAVGVTGVLVYQLFGADVRDIGGRSLVPAPLCSDTRRSTELLTEQLSEANVTVLFSVDRRGCNRLTPAAARRAARQVVRQQRALGRVGLPAPSERMYVGLMRVGQGPRVQVSGRRGAFALNVTGSRVPLNAARGVAEVSVQHLAPGIRPAVRERLGYAFGLLAAGTRRDVSAARAELAGGRPHGSGGLFEAWVMSEHGTRPVVDALASCTGGCTWQSALSDALRRHGLSLPALERQFSR